MVSFWRFLRFREPGLSPGSRGSRPPLRGGLAKLITWGGSRPPRDPGTGLWGTKIGQNLIRVWPIFPYFKKEIGEKFYIFLLVFLFLKREIRGIRPKPGKPDFGRKNWIHLRPNFDEMGVNWLPGEADGGPLTGPPGPDLSAWVNLRQFGSKWDKFLVPDGTKNWKFRFSKSSFQKLVIFWSFSGGGFDLVRPGPDLLRA